MSAPIYPLEVLIEAERRQDALMAANVEERARAVKRTLRRYCLQQARREREAYRRIGRALDLAAANLWRGSPRRMAALLVFERQWKRERRGYRRLGLRVSGHDATEQFVRCICLWRVARVIGVGGWGSEDWTGVTAGSEWVS